MMRTPPDRSWSAGSIVRPGSGDKRGLFIGSFTHSLRFALRNEYQNESIWRTSQSFSRRFHYKLVGGLEHVIFSQYIGNNHPNCITHIFQGGSYTTNQIQFRATLMSIISRNLHLSMVFYYARDYDDAVSKALHHGLQRQAWSSACVGVAGEQSLQFEQCDLNPCWLMITGGLEHLDYFPIYWGWWSNLTFIFSEWDETSTTNQINYLGIILRNILGMIIIQESMD